MRFVDAYEGQSQQALAERLGIPPSRMVALVDHLEEAGLVERRPDPEDRRVRGLYLTRKGRGVLERAGKIAIDYETRLCAGINREERELLIDLLQKLQEGQTDLRGVHPGHGAGEALMAKLLIHLASGPENPTRGALALLVARTAAEEGHDVQVFIAGDGVQYARPATASIVQGVGTGSFGEHWEALVSAGVPIYLSGMSSNARGLEPDAVADGAEMAPPTKLVELAVWADSTLTY